MMATTKTAKIFIRNLDHIRTSTEPVHGHYIAESFDDVSLAFGNMKTQIDALNAEIAALKKTPTKG